MARIVWVTGGSAGIGRALAATVPWEDTEVVDVSRSGGTPDTEHLPADLADPASWPAFAAHVNARLGLAEYDRVTLVHAAGTLAPIGFAGEVDLGAYRQQVLLDAAAPLALGASFLEALDRADHTDRADLVLLSSGAATSVYEGWSAYCAGKAAVEAWVRVVGAERERRGSRCRVVAVAPGVVATGMQEQIRATDPFDFPQHEKFVRLHEDGELVTPEHAARGIWDVLDDDAVPNGGVLDLRDR